MRCKADPDQVIALDYEPKNADDSMTSNWKPLIKVAVSGAAGQICNHLLFMLASGEVYGKDQPIELRLLGSEKSIGAIEGVAMELEDSLYPLLQSVAIGIEPEKVFADADWALLVGAKPRGPGMERADLLDLNGQVFEKQGKALDKVISFPIHNLLGLSRAPVAPKQGRSRGRAQQRRTYILATAGATRW